MAVGLIEPQAFTAWATAAAGFTGGAFALIRLSLLQQRSVTEQFTHYLETALARQTELNAGFRESIDRLSETVRSWRCPLC
jgi:hypothetical protein